MINCVAYNFLVVYNGFAGNFTAQKDHSRLGNSFCEEKKKQTKHMNYIPIGLAWHTREEKGSDHSHNKET